MSQIKPHAENRKYPRISDSVAYSLILDGEQHTGVTGNISIGGVYLKTISPPLQNTSISKSGTITLQIPPKSLDMKCSVVYIGGQAVPHPEGVGIAFSDLSEVTIATLNEYIQSKL